MSQQLKYLEGCIRDAHIDENAVAMLRAIISGATACAPVDDLILIANTLVEIRKRDLRDEISKN